MKKARLNNIDLTLSLINKELNFKLKLYTSRSKFDKVSKFYWLSVKNILVRCQNLNGPVSILYTNYTYYYTYKN